AVPHMPLSGQVGKDRSVLHGSQLLLRLHQAPSAQEHLPLFFSRTRCQLEEVSEGAGPLSVRSSLTPSIALLPPLRGRGLPPCPRVSPEPALHHVPPGRCAPALQRHTPEWSHCSF